MSFVEVDGARIHYRIDGADDAPVLVLSNSLGADLSMWDPQIPSFARHFRVLRYDCRGHGASTVTPGPYTIERLGRDVIGLLDQLRIAKAHCCGLSLGGIVAMWVATHAPERIERLALCNTAARIGPPELWDARIDAIRNDGVAAIAQAVLGRWFSPAFLARRPDLVAPLRQMMERTPADGYIGCCAAVRDIDQRDSIARIVAPTLVVSGVHDVATPAADGRFLAERIRGSRYVELDAAHLSNIEAAEAFTAAVLRFFMEGHDRMDERERYAAGMEVRRAVLGDAHVDRTLRDRSAFSEEFQDLITRYAWGEVWTRPGLPRHTRSLLTVAILVAQNRADELRMHVRAAANNGVTRDEIKEVLLQAAIYCGVPAANTAFHIAQEVFAEADAKR